MRHAPVRGCNPPEGSPEGVLFSKASSRAKRGSAERSEAVPPSEARLHRAKRGSTERSEAPPSEARLHRAKRGSTERSEAARRRSSGGRHYKKTQKGSTRKPRGTTYFICEKLFLILPANEMFIKQPGYD